MSIAHSKPKHDTFVIAFAVALVKGGLSIRKASKEASRVFNVKVTHTSLSNWLREEFGHGVEDATIRDLDGLDQEEIEEILQGGSSL